MRQSGACGARRSTTWRFGGGHAVDGIPLTAVNTRNRHDANLRSQR
jgi:hypothetical protein